MVNTMCGSAWQALWHFFLCCVFARCATSEHHQFPPAAVICVVARHAVNTLHEFPWQSWEILRVSLVWFKLYGKQRRRKNCSANLSFFPFFFFFYTSSNWTERPENKTTRPLAHLWLEEQTVFQFQISNSPELCNILPKQQTMGGLRQWNNLQSAERCMTHHMWPHKNTGVACVKQHTQACTVITATYTVDKKLGKMAAT